MRGLLIACAVTACSSDPGPPTDPCAMKPVVAGGTVELGLGTVGSSAFTPITDGETVQIQHGAQGLSMLVVDARTHDMHVGSGATQGILDVESLDNGVTVSLITTCRTVDFATGTDGYLELTAPFLLPFDPDVEPSPVDGKTINIQLELRDIDGHMATDSHTVITQDLTN